MWVLGLLMTVANACGSPTTPTPTLQSSTVSPTEISYTINIPTVARTQQLKNQYPNGILLAPVTAQRQYDYQSAYGGSPNVYAGEAVVVDQSYFGTGIVVAPYAAASKDVFQGMDWPLLFGTRPLEAFAWRGYFVYARFQLIVTGF